MVVVVEGGSPDNDISAEFGTLFKSSSAQYAFFCVYLYLCVNVTIIQSKTGDIHIWDSHVI